MKCNIRFGKLSKLRYNEINCFINSWRITRKLFPDGFRESAPRRNLSYVRQIATFMFNSN